MVHGITSSVARDQVLKAFTMAELSRRPRAGQSTSKHSFRRGWRPEGPAGGRGVLEYSRRAGGRGVLEYSLRAGGRKAPAGDQFGRFG